MKKNKILIVEMLALALIFTLSVASCSGKTINSAEELKAYLDNQPANNPDKPIKVTMRINDQMLPEVSTVLRDTDKYVNLNISGNALTTIPKFTFSDCKTLVSITLPNIVNKTVETDVIANWSLPIESGIVEYFELNMGETLKEEVDKKTGVKYMIVIESSESSLQPRIGILNDKDELMGQLYYLTNNSVIFVENGQKINKGEILAKRVTLPEIEVNAFYDCTSLTSVTIGNGVTGIRDSAFNGCTSLTSITIPNSVTNIGEYAFYGCKSLTSITIPNSVTNIGECAFYGCKSLTSITIPNSVTSIGSAAFSGCTSLASVTIGNGVTEIGWYTFQGCTSLTSITIPNSVTGIYRQAFHDCPNLTSVTFQGKIDTLDRYAFSFADKENRLYYNDLLDKFLAGGPGTYTTTAPVDKNSKWTKQPESSNKSVPAVKSSGKVSAFPGRWQLVEGRGDAKDMELFKDGTGTADGKGITWKIENGRFHLLHPNQTFSAYYNVTGSTITFTQDNGVVTKYQKK